MDGVTVCLQARNHNLAVLVAENFRFADRHGSVLDSSRIHLSNVVNLEGDIPDSVTVLAQVAVDSLQLSSIIDGDGVTVGALQRRCEDKADRTVLDNMGGDGAGASLEATICHGTETHACDVIRSSLFGVPDIPVEISKVSPRQVEGGSVIEGSYQWTWS